MKILHSIRKSSFEFIYSFWALLKLRRTSVQNDLEQDYLLTNRENQVAVLDLKIQPDIVN